MTFHRHSGAVEKQSDPESGSSGGHPSGLNLGLDTCRSNETEGERERESMKVNAVEWKSWSDVPVRSRPAV